MTTRRSFLELGAKAMAAGCLAGRTALAAPAGVIYGVQMYEVREQAATDFAGALKSVKDAGFDQVELFPLAYKRPAAELKKMLDDAGLGAASGHFDYSSRDMSVDYAKVIGLKYVVCPMVPQSQWGSLDGFRQAAKYFNEWGDAARKAGMEFVFHNHDYEFKPLEGSTGFNEIIKGTDASLVKLELDVFWLAQAGQDPMTMLKKFPDRAVLIHLKDRAAGSQVSYQMNAASAGNIVELGKGSIEVPALLRQAKAQGIRYAYLDQDETKLPVEQSMKEARAYLRKLAI